MLGVLVSSIPTRGWVRLVPTSLKCPDAGGRLCTASPHQVLTPIRSLIDTPACNLPGSIDSARRHPRCSSARRACLPAIPTPDAWCPELRQPHGRQLELRHGRHAACSTSPRGVVKPQKFRKKATFEQEHGKRQAALEGVTDATASAHLYKAFYTF